MTYFEESKNVFCCCETGVSFWRSWSQLRCNVFQQFIEFVGPSKPDIFFDPFTRYGVCFVLHSSFQYGSGYVLQESHCVFFEDYFQVLQIWCKIPPFFVWKRVINSAGMFGYSSDSVPSELRYRSSQVCFCSSMSLELCDEVISGDGITLPAISGIHCLQIKQSGNFFLL